MLARGWVRGYPAVLYPSAKEVDVASESPPGVGLQGEWWQSEPALGYLLAESEKMIVVERQIPKMPSIRRVSQSEKFSSSFMVLRHAWP